MNVGDKVLAVPIEGDPQNIIMLPATNAPEAGDGAVLFALDEHNEMLSALIPKVIEVGDIGVLIPIGGDSSNVVFVNGILPPVVLPCGLYDADETTTFWDFPGWVYSGYNTVNKYIELPSWWNVVDDAEFVNIRVAISAVIFNVNVTVAVYDEFGANVFLHDYSVGADTTDVRVVPIPSEHLEPSGVIRILARAFFFGIVPGAGIGPLEILGRPIFEYCEEPINSSDLT